MSIQTNFSTSVSSENRNPDYKTLYEELQVKQQFLLSQISHEIRNPVTLINSFLQLFESRHPEIIQDYYWKNIIENMDFLKALLNEFSTFNNSKKLQMQEINLYQLLFDTVNSIIPVCEDAAISVVLKKETAIPTILADQTKIQQLILNLLRNAREAIGSQGIITCSLKSDGETVSISIHDNGPGIPENYQRDLFEPFITHKQEGTGLGLAICKRIAETHGGNISYTSISGEGTCFTLTLPVR